MSAGGVKVDVGGSAIGVACCVWFWPTAGTTFDVKSNCTVQLGICKVCTADICPN